MTVDSETLKDLEQNAIVFAYESLTQFDKQFNLWNQTKGDLMSLFKSALFIFLFMSIFVVGYLVNLEVLPYQAAPILGIIIGMIMKKTWSSI